MYSYNINGNATLTISILLPKGHHSDILSTHPSSLLFNCQLNMNCALEHHLYYMLSWPWQITVMMAFGEALYGSDILYGFFEPILQLMVMWKLMAWKLLIPWTINYSKFTKMLAFMILLNPHIMSTSGKIEGFLTCQSYNNYYVTMNLDLLA